MSIYDSFILLMHDWFIWLSLGSVCHSIHGLPHTIVICRMLFVVDIQDSLKEVTKHVRTLRCVTAF